ncbi:MAG: hypothetical protein ACJ8HI_07685 [Massilia sp.]
MNPLKHMELIFGLVVAAGLLVAAAAEHNARAATPDSQASAAVSQPIASAGNMAVVVIHGKRMSSREKRRAALSAADGVRIF